MDIYCNEEGIKQGMIILRTYIIKHCIEFIGGAWYQAFRFCNNFTSEAKS
jgi:hypothetical protein